MVAPPEPASSAITVSVVIPLYGGVDLIGDCIRSIPVGIETVVIDDGSTDGAPELVQAEFPSVRVERNDHNLGFGQTANRGLSLVSGTVRIVMNSDARFQPGSLEALVEAFRDEKVGIAGPHLVFPDGSHQLSAANFPTVGRLMAGSFFLSEVHQWLRPGRAFRWQMGLTKRDHDSSRDVDWVHGTCFAVRDACFDQTGGFDAAYRMYVEECDMCWRAAQLGWTVRYVAESFVVHIGAASGGGNPGGQAKHNIAGEAIFMQRAYGPQVLPKWWAARLISSAVKCAVLAPFALAGGRLAERWHWQRAAVAELFRNRRALLKD